MIVLRFLEEFIAKLYWYTNETLSSSRFLFSQSRQQWLLNQGKYMVTTIFQQTIILR